MEPNQATADSPETVDVAAQAVSSSTPDGDTNQVVTESDPGDFDAQLAAADSPDAIAKLITTLSATPAAPAVVDAGEAEEQLGGEKAKAGEDDGPLDLTKLPTRFRSTMREEDDVGRLAMSLKHRNKDWTLEESVQAARKHLGKDSDAQPAPAPVAAAPETAPPAVDELAGIEAKIAEVKAQRKAAMANVELDKVAELDEQLDALKDQRTEAKTAPKPTPKPADTQGKPANLADYNAAFDASLAKAANLYPFIQEAESAAAMRMVEIDNALEANKDPLFSAPDKPLRIAQMVAAEMAIAPRTASAVKTPTAAKSQQVTSRSVSPIASGASRTTTTRTQDASSAAEILSIKTPEDLERYLAKQAGAKI
jgi:hypothetical protein